MPVENSPISGRLSFFVVVLVLGACSSSGDTLSPSRTVPPRNPTFSATGGSGVRAPGAAGANGLINPPSQNFGNFGNPAAQPIPAAQPVMPTSEVCGSVDLAASRIVPSVMLVVDGSSSMQMNGYPATVPLDENGLVPAGMTRWDAIRKALVDPTSGLVPTLQGLVKFGLALYGTFPTCPLPTGVIEPNLNNGPAITRGMPATAPGLFTPTGPALDAVVSHLPDPQAVGPDGIPPGPVLVVLATDGDPNACEDPTTNYQPSIDAANKLQAKHLPMYVISVGNEASKDHLQQMANIGAGMPATASPGAMVYYPEDPAGLAMTLKSLVGMELSCDLQLSGKGVKVGSECMGMVTLNGKLLECNGADGWVLTDSTHISLKGATCEMYKNATDAVIHAKFPCEAVVPS